jgi:hypothetical protein
MDSANPNIKSDKVWILGLGLKPGCSSLMSGLPLDSMDLAVGCINNLQVSTK